MPLPESDNDFIYFEVIRQNLEIFCGIDLRKMDK